MTYPKPEIDKLKLAWKRIQRDRPDKIFATHPHICDWLADDLDEWLQYIAGLVGGGYSPQAACPCPAPKPGYLIRPGSVLSIEDELVYAFVVSELFPFICDLLAANQGSTDLAHLLANDITSEAWIRSDSKIWAKWREDSLQALDESNFVLTTDIVGYYDNIELSILSSDVKTACGNHEIIPLLMQCLNRWSQPRGRGIPQGYSSSHILAKLYLYSLDQHLKDLGYAHLRYVDDVRVFCKTKLEAQKAIIDIGKFLSKRGLNLQGAKTRILTKDEAETEFDGVSKIIGAIQSDLKSELEDLLSTFGTYISESDLLKAIEISEEPPIELLEKGFTDYLVQGEFDKTLFHYLLTRLGKAGSIKAIDYCIEQLLARPEETGPILRYLGAVSIEQALIEQIGNYFLGESCIYDHQKYQFMRWCSNQELCPGIFIDIARQWAFNGALPDWIRSNAISVLGKEAIGHDLEVIEARYDEQTSEILKACCVFACRFQEKGRRNAFYAKVEHDGYLIKLAIKAAKSATPK